jgi:hypothetical protein
MYFRNRNQENLFPCSCEEEQNKSKTDGERLKEAGIYDLDSLLEECMLISEKKSKLSKHVRDLVIKYSTEAYKELKTKAEEIKEESLINNNKKEDE